LKQTAVFRPGTPKAVVELTGSTPRTPSASGGNLADQQRGWSSWCQAGLILRQKGWSGEVVLV